MANNIYSPQFSGSAIIFTSGSHGAEQQINSFTSSNPDLIVSGTHQGTWLGTSDHHLKYLDAGVSGSHSVWGPWTGSYINHTESGANSHGIPVGSASIFSSSMDMGFYPNQQSGSYAGQTPIVISMSNAGDFSISAKAAGGAVKDAPILFVKAGTGNIGIGTENPTKAMELNGNAASATNAAGVTTLARTTNAAHYISFTGGTTGVQPQYVEANLQYNPATRRLSAPYFVGDGSLLTNLPGGGSECADKVKVFNMLEGVHPIIAEPLATEGEEPGDCETVFSCQKIAVDCVKMGIWINGGFIGHDRGTFTFEFEGGKTTIRVEPPKKG